MSVQAVTADGWKIVVVSAVGPATTTSVTAGSAANINLAVQTTAAIVRDFLSLSSLSGLPDGVVLVGVSYPDLSTVRVRVFNPTGSNINVTANSVTATLLAKAL